jgi:hypothetical protein
MAKKSVRIASLRYHCAVRRSGSLACFLVIWDLLKIVDTLHSKGFKSRAFLKGNNSLARESEFYSLKLSESLNFVL